MKTVIQLSLAAILLALSSMVIAQPPGRRGPPEPAERVERLSTELQLSAEQKASILTIMQAADADRQQQRGKHCGSNVDRQARQNVVDEQIALVLTEAQRQLFDALRAERTNQRKAGKQKANDCG